MDCPSHGRADLVARSRALRALAAAYPEEFERVFAEELVKVGLAPRPARRRCDPEMVAEMYQRMTLAEIASRLGFSYETVRQALVTAGVERRRAGRRISA